MISVNAVEGVGHEEVSRVSGEPFGSRAASLSGVVGVDPFEVAGPDDMPASDMALLAAALEDALDARSAGVLIGPDADEIAWRRATRRAYRADTARVLRTRMGGDAA